MLSWGRLWSNGPLHMLIPREDFVLGIAFYMVCVCVFLHICFMCWVQKWTKDFSSECVSASVCRGKTRTRRWVLWWQKQNIFTVRDLEATHLHIHALRITTTKNALPQPHQKATTMPSFLLTHIILDHLTLLIILPKCSKTYIFK